LLRAIVVLLLVSDFHSSEMCPEATKPGSFTCPNATG